LYADREKIFVEDGKSCKNYVITVYSDGDHFIRRATGGILSFDEKIGKTRSLSDAFDLIKADSGGSRLDIR
jgi:hypothetical protein